MLNKCLLLLLLLSRCSCVQLCATPQTAAHQAPPYLGFSRQELWSGLPFPCPMQESEKWKWSRSVVSDPQRPHGLQPTRLLHPWDFPGKSTGVGCHCFLCNKCLLTSNWAWSLLLSGVPQSWDCKTEPWELISGGPELSGSASFTFTCQKSVKV